MRRHMWNDGQDRHPAATARAAVATVVAAVICSLGIVTAAPAAEAAVGVPTTYDGPSYAASVTRPSENKPQSKLWFVDGSWWALMTTGSSTTTRIHKLLPDHTWRDTGTVVDTRLNSTGDALWSSRDGKLFVASRADTSNLNVARFSYAAATDTWSLDPGFPIAVNTGGGSESATIDRDSTGRLWVTYTRASRLWVAHSDVAGTTWTAGFQPNVPDTVITSDDISALVAFGDSIGLLWSDQQSGAFRFAIHEDGDPSTTWRVEDALAGTTAADDHINIKQISSDSRGRIFAAVKTSNDAGGPGAPLVGVLVRTPGANGSAGTWEFVVAGTVADDHTRPIIMIDETNQELYFFATAPVSGGDIYVKKTSLANPSFGPGRGALFVDSARQVNNASGSKDPVSAATGMVVLAVAEGVKRYVHAEMQLAGGGAPPTDTTAPSTPTNLLATPAAGRVDLAWSASTDDVGVNGYRVRRGGAVVATTTSPSHVDTNVSPGATYSYTVEAFDAAANTSAASAPVSVTVPDDAPPEPGTIAFRAASSATNSAAATLTIGVPGAVVAGDVLVASVDYRGGASVTAPAGWLLARLDRSGTTAQKATYTRVASAGEPSSYTWQFSARPAAVGTILAYSGVSATAPVQASAGQVNAASKNLTAPSVPASAGSVVVTLYGMARAAAITPPTGNTERSEVVSPSGTTYPMTGETSDRAQAVGGASGTRVALSTVSGPSIGHTLALNPAN